jgi:hypothetical protein
MFLRRGGGTYNPGLYVNLSDTINNEIIFNTTYSTGNAPSYVWQNADAEIMRLNNTGLGIGTSSPGAKLDVNGEVRIYPASSPAQIRFGVGGAEKGKLSVDTSSNMAFETAGSERMRITSAGNVGIGTASPVTRLHVSQSNSGDYASVALLSNSADAAADRTGIYGSPAPGTANPYRGGITFWPGSSGAVSIHTGNNATPGAGERVRIDGTNGNVGIGTSSPGAKLTVNDANNIPVRMGDIAAAPVSQTAVYVGVSTSALSGGNGDLVLIPRTSDARSVLFYTGNGTAAERMRIDSVGNVGIGLAAPDARLHLHSTAGGGDLPRMRFTNGGTGTGATDGMFVGISNTSQFDIWNFENDAMRFATNNTERMRIDSSGNLLVGQTANGLQNSNSAAITPSAGNQVVLNKVTGSGSGNAYVVFGYAAGTIGSITQSGTTAVLYNTSSDARLKENIADADDAAALIDALQVRKFDWKTDNSHQRYGFVAQELLEVAPEAVSQPENPDKMMGVDYSKLVPMLVKELQSVRARLAELEGK